MFGATLHQLLLLNGSEIAKNIQQNIFVDNVVPDFSNANVAIDFYN